MLAKFLKGDPAKWQRGAEGGNQAGNRRATQGCPPSLQAVQTPGMLPNLLNIIDLGHFLANHVGGYFPGPPDLQILD